jgi:RNA polymerase sigma-B factor
MTPHRHAGPGARGDWRGDNLVTLFGRCSAGDEQARDTIILRFLPLARRIARQYEGRGEPRDDLVQVASVGLIKAVDRYSPARGDTFVAYARPMVVGEILRYFRDATWRVHVPRTLRERASRVARADAALVAPAGAPSQPQAIASSLDLEVSEVKEAQAAWAAYRPASLDAARASPNGGALALRHDVVGEDDPGYERAEVSVGIGRALRDLRPRDQRILLLRLCCELTQREIAARVGLSQMHVSRVLRRGNAAVAEACGLCGGALMS